MPGKLLCRLCLGGNDDYIEIYSEIGNQLRISEIISQHLSFQVKENDEISDKICTLCWSKLIDFHDFYTHVQKAQETITIIEVKFGLDHRTGLKETFISDTIFKVDNIQFSDDEDVDVEVYENDFFKEGNLDEQSEQSHSNNITDLQIESELSLLESKSAVNEDEYESVIIKKATVFIPETTENDDNESQQESSSAQPELTTDELIHGINSEQNEIVYELQTQSTSVPSHSQKQSDNNLDKRTLIINNLNKTNENETISRSCITSPSSMIKQEEFFVQDQETEKYCSTEEYENNDDDDGSSSNTDSEEYIPKKKKKKKISSSSISSKQSRRRNNNNRKNVNNNNNNGYISGGGRKAEITVSNKDKDEAIIESYYKMSCEICNEQFKHFELLFAHYSKSHNIRGFITCCGKKYSKRSLIAEHVLWHNQPDLFKCKICDKLYSDKRCLTNHLISHEPPDMKLYKCDHCSKGFVKKFKLERHKLCHLTAEEKKYICDECEKPYASVTLLKAHKRVVHEKTYSHMCEICARVFKSRIFFEKHQLEHLGKNLPRVQCQICDAWMKNEHTMRAHMRLHQDADTIHECDICGKQGPSRNAILKHKRFVHLSERKHKCTLCDKAFKRAITLKEHMSVHTGEVLYTCTFCPKTFNSGANMHAHRKKAHPVEWENEKLIKMESMKSTATTLSSVRENDNWEMGKNVS